ncbi:MAG: DUF4190 domain-containing protein [Victivallales bacterium]|nr:DUF4190 domain-containing protein [Victivallales bacterium]
MGIATLVIGIISLIISFIPCVGWFVLIPAIIGLILGIVGVCMEKTKGKAIAGLVLNLLAVCVIVGMSFLMADAATGGPISRAVEKNKMDSCKNNQKMILLGILLYVEDHADCLPPADNYRELLAKDVDAKLWQCPSGGEYQYFGNGQKTMSLGASASTVLLVCPGHQENQIVGFADGHVESLPPEQVKVAIEHCEPGELPVLER